jgi:hypothetical protein
VTTVSIIPGFPLLALYCYSQLYEEHSSAPYSRRRTATPCQQLHSTQILASDFGLSYSCNIAVGVILVYHVYRPLPVMKQNTFGTDTITASYNHSKIIHCLIFFVASGEITERNN